MRRSSDSCTAAKRALFDHLAAMTARRFPRPVYSKKWPPFMVCDSSGQKLADAHCEEEPGRRDAALEFMFLSAHIWET
jgi:hypothetical protein